MNTKTLVNRSLSVIDEYIHFKVGTAVCSVPYFNNKTVKARAALRVYSGKGSPRDIFDEVQTLAVQTHSSIDLITDESLKKLLVDSGIGIDCSALAYYVLNAESEARGSGALDKKLSFADQGGFFSKLRSALRPVENCSVVTFCHDKNSHPINLADAACGDMITMRDDIGEAERNHILVIHQIEYQNFVPTKIHYSHAMAYPEDGIYGSGTRQGTIEIADKNAPLTSALWSENGSPEGAAHVFNRANKSKTELRRLNWF